MKTKSIRISTVTVILAQALLGTGLVLSPIGAARANDTTAAVSQYVDDATITTQIKSKFAADSAVSTLAIGVETKDGVVQLSGFSKSALEKTRAEELAKQVKGVTKVRNDIVSKP